VAFTFITRFLGRTTSEAAGFGIGGAMRSPLEPPLQELTNETWRAFVGSGVTIPTDIGDAAEIVAEDVAQESWGRDQVAQLGYGADQFDKLVNAVLNAPGMGELLQARRRGAITQAEFEHGLRKNRLETLWDGPVAALLDVLLSASDLANAVVQGHRSMEQATADAADVGMSAANFQTLVDNTGLPPGPETLLEWRRRNIIDDAQLDTGIREGHTKTKYIPFFHAALQPVLSHTTYAGLRLRGWLTKAESDAGGALTGFTPEQMQLEFLNRGRPATAHQIHIGYARGAKLAGATDEIDAINTAIQQSDIRPEYAPLIVAGRYTLPSAFALRGLVSSGAVTEAEGATILIQSGWQPDLAKSVAAFWAHPTNSTATVNPRLKRAQDQVYNAAHKSYLDNEIDRARAIAALEHIGVPNTVADDVVSLWEYENEITIKPLTPAAIKKAYSENTFTIDDATARLVNQQWSAADAAVYLKS
jgi:hypothetical protein